MATINRSNIQNNGTNTTNGKVNSTRTNGNGATARAARLQAKTESRRTTSSQTVEERAAELLEEVRNSIYKSFKVKLQTRDKRIAIKVGHATKEKLGLDIAAQIRKSGKQMNWDKWNNQVFPKLFGRPDALDHDVEVVALCMAMLYDVFELDVNQAIKGLVEFNQESLKKRNDYKKESEADDEDDDEDEEELLDLEGEDESEDSDLTEDEDEDDEDDELE